MTRPLTLTDAGPLIALLNRRDTHHRACVDALNSIRLPLVTTWPAFTESLFLLNTWHAQSALWRMVTDGRLELFNLDQQLTNRTAELMEKYQDVPMELADATLVAVAERLRQRRIFTVDRSDFSIYRIGGRKTFEIIP